MVDDAHGWEVGALEAGSLAQTTGATSGRLLVPASVPLTLTGYEYSFMELADGFDLPLHAAVLQAQPAVTAPTAIDVDFSDSASPAAVSGSFSYPVRSASPLRTAFPYAVVYHQFVRSRGPQYLLQAHSGIGFPSRARRSADGSTVNYDLQHVTPTAPVMSPVTRYMLWRDADTAAIVGPLSVVEVEGLPTAGAQTFEFLDVAKMTDPATGVECQPLHDPFTWEVFETGATPTLYLRRSAVTGEINGRNVWWTTAPTDAMTLTVPDPPSAMTTADLVSLLGAGTLRGSLGLRDDAPGDVRDRYSETRPYLVVP